MVTYGELLGVGGLGHSQLTTILSGVTVTIGAAGGAPMPGVSYNKLDARFAYYGGHVGPWGPTFPRNLFEKTYNVTLADGTRAGMQGALAFETDALRFEFWLYAAGPGAAFTVLVDGQAVTSANIIPPNDGSGRYVTIDLSGAGLSAGFHSIEIDFGGGVDFGGLVTPQGTTIRAPSDGGPRLVFLGDSFTEGNGAANAAADFPSYVARSLGMPDVWQSALGGTGWVQSLNNRPGLVTRMEADGVGAMGDIYVIAMGINDRSSVYQAVIDSLTVLITGRPGAKVFVIGPWNPSAPELGPATSIDAEMRAACALFDSVVYLDPSQLWFPRWDATHPNAEGQVRIGQWVTAQIKYHLGIDGCVEQGRAGDTVGALFLDAFDPSAVYSFQVLVDGVASDAFTVVATGDAFPVLKLADGFALDELGPHSVTVLVTSGSDSIAIPVSFTVRAHRDGGDAGEYIRFTSAAVSIDGQGGNDYLIGSGQDDHLSGGDGDDKLDGGGGADILVGGAGDDSYWVDSVADVLVESAGGGVDTVTALVEGYGLIDGFEGLNLGDGIIMGFGNAAGNLLRGNALDNLLSGQKGNDFLLGYAGADTLRGGEGNDKIDGGTGLDRLEGGIGDDVYYVDAPGDVVVEGTNCGSDRVIATVSGCVLAGNVEALELAGAAMSGTGNSLANAMIGNPLDNVLVGLAGNDRLDGRAGADRLEGGTGDDVYFVDCFGDIVVEKAGEGSDTVHVTGAGGWLMTANIEIARLSGAADAVTGNAGANSLFANAALASSLSGGDGNDMLLAAGGDDILTGGAGNDVYWVDGTGVSVVEGAAGGTDRVVATVSGYVLADHVEGLNLGGTAATGFGNAQGNYIIGGSVACELWGMGGADRLDGRDFGDRLHGGDDNDQLYGFKGNDWLYGDAGTDTLDGGEGDDVLCGGAGIDYIRGGAGLDTGLIALAFAQCSLVFTASGLKVIDLATGEYDLFTAVETIQFADYAVTVDYLLATLAAAPVNSDLFA